MNSFTVDLAMRIKSAYAKVSLHYVLKSCPINKVHTKKIYTLQLFANKKMWLSPIAVVMICASRIATLNSESVEQNVKTKRTHAFAIREYPAIKKKKKKHSW